MRSSVLLGPSVLSGWCIHLCLCTLFRSSNYHRWFDTSHFVSDLGVSEPTGLQPPRPPPQHWFPCRPLCCPASETGFPCFLMSPHTCNREKEKPSLVTQCSCYSRFVHFWKKWAVILNPTVLMNRDKMLSFRNKPAWRLWEFLFSFTSVNQQRSLQLTFS